MKSRSQQTGLRPVVPPVSASEIRRSGWFHDVFKPMAQSATLGLAFVQLVFSFLVLCVAAGPGAYWVSAACISISAFLWALTRSRQSWGDGVGRAAQLIGAFSLSGIAGYVAVSVSRVVSWGAPTWATRIPAWAAFAWFVFSLWYFPHLEVSVAQRLAIPSMFQDRHVWQAVGKWIEWRLKRSPPPANGRRPILNKSPRRAAPELPEREPDAVEALSEIELFLRLADRTGMIKRDGGLAGMTLDNGEKVTKNLWARNMAILHEQGYVTNGGSGYAWATGQSAQAALEALV